MGHTILNDDLSGIERFDANEIQRVLANMGKKKASDKQGLILEMLLHGGQLVAENLANLFNELLVTGNFPQNWYDSWFNLLPKKGDLDDPCHWRPIAILSISYKILARAVYERIRTHLDSRQAEDQYGFRRKRSTSQALLVLENIMGKALEFNTDIWIISLDLRKAFDRVEHGRLFESLLDQGLPVGYVTLLKLLYRRQRGKLNGDIEFPICRGVRQGDVLSPLLFNSCLEAAIAKWKTKLTDHGLALEPQEGTERLTNIRFADDLVLVGKSLEEAVHMMELLVDTLREYGLNLHAQKTVIFSTVPPPEVPSFCDTAFGFVQVLHSSGSHTYLGRRFSGDSKHRGRTALEHRIGCAWAKFRTLSSTLTNSHIPIKLRLRLFNAVVSPTVLYALDTAPLTKSMLIKLDATQRCMLRRMVGWTCYSSETWQERGHRMKIRLQQALSKFPVEDWSKTWSNRVQSLKSCMHTAPKWTQLSYAWDPRECATRNGHFAYRSAGRPRVKW